MHGVLAVSANSYAPKKHTEEILNRERFESGMKDAGASWNGIILEAERVVDDTREVQRGDIFVLRQGANELSPGQAMEFCSKARQAGAVAVIADPKYSLNLDIPVISLANPHLKLGEIAEAFYGTPSKHMKVIAVTGTNGKTTTTYLIESLAKAMGLKVGVMGTVSHRYPGYEEASANTTPGTLKLYRLMDGMVKAGCELVAMEVSSHGIMQGRVDGIAFDAAIWNNLGTDHLDFHKTREAYALAKQRLFDHYLALSFRAGKHPVAIANGDDDEVVGHISAANPQSWGGSVRSFSIFGKSAELEIRNVLWKNGAWQIEFCENGCIFKSALPLVGQYNIANAAGAVSALRGIGYDLKTLADALPRIDQIPGRMECICAHPVVIVDFAHTPEALENALIAARSCVPEGGNLSVVFGAGGDRDPSKRPMMGQIAEKLADKCFVTSDNPRTEEPQTIINQILAGMNKPDEVWSHVDRALAIDQAIWAASDEDVILIAGKGHEDYQILGTTKIHFDDREICREVLKKLGR